MLKKIITVPIIIMLPLALLSQDAKKAPSKEPSRETVKKDDFPIQSIAANFFSINHITFTKVNDPTGKGELMQVSFELKNLIDLPLDFYIFVIASYEVPYQEMSSFRSPAVRGENIKNFAPFPDDMDNFEYDNSAGEGGKTRLVKYPKRPTAGIYPPTGKPYRLVDNLIVRTKHLSKYRKDYVFFNMVTILVFEENKKKGEMELVYRQLYHVHGQRR
jgi:hypothetical protein